ncbi:hypothetical protein ACQP1O_37750 [Nocardia sp. CA-151230]|uniref:hypothetical protein n=1 Tax=Nocardia sp. CA-151230 TaxID=3239982 RepID=UPI003D8BF10F
MTDPLVTPVSRAVRAAIFAVIAVAVSAAGHGHVVGHELSFSGLVVACAATAAVAWAFADRQWGVLPIAGGLAGMQLVLHLWFGLAPMSGGHMNHGAGMSAGANTPAMIAAHCLAAMFCGIWLWRGERALFALLRALYARFFVPLLLVYLHPTVPAGIPTGRVAEYGVPKTSQTLLRHVLARRGPPACAFQV